MTRNAAPRLLEAILLRLLPDRDRDTISGDLREEFSDRCAHSGAVHARLWYSRQVVSFMPARLRSALADGPALALLCMFTASAGLWLGAMDLYLKHPGYKGREWIACTIVGEALLTLIAMYAPGSRPLRYVAMAGCAGILYLAAMALVGLVRGDRFEGYILLIALALTLQSALTLATLPRKRRSA